MNLDIVCHESLGVLMGFFYFQHDAFKQICMVLDLDGYRIKSGFLLREMGWCTSQGVAQSLHFKSSHQYHQLSAKDKRSVDHVYHNIHALPFEAAPEELAVSEHVAPQIVRCIYLTSCTPDRPLVAYKGGQLERDLLRKLRIPAVNLEWWGCPRADQLGECQLTCGFHHKNIGHCPLAETYLFHTWMQQQM